ncbi:PLD nuclease N-terminal domain-containing protein [Caldilinea sp.]|uniref:PLD nuclease N-terminal domain-containing protein n=1 Tax=Caldilinea sp. TaxID=2293560 RepID=UPI002B817EF3|nr:PLDc_N domain-containing protein [Anaerolineales bacterium]HQY92450.1 PLD nuclease N-terminal domain-containing protein [Caldilinea sp.]HRA67676.1 PLD nuclease N-terminal domain-containing protein [Caldilinea sp.]
MSQKKTWKRLEPWQKAGGVMLGIVQVSLLIAALVDIRRRPATEIRGRKAWWVMAAFVNYVGPISYFLFGRKQTAALVAGE